MSTASIQTQKTKFQCIDVFSGTGGISLALDSFCNTVLYCEQHPYCQAVLTERMKNNQLHKAPIHSDINTLYVSPYTSANMLMGGFPCQDVSSRGLPGGCSS
jgi:site-specific DNA-cytosine methylase